MNLLEFSKFDVAFKYLLLTSLFNIQHQIFSLQAIKSRTKKNVITLTGQIISFAFEISIPLICELLLTKFGSNANIIEPAGIPIIIIFGTTLIAVAQFLTSPELRRFYFQMPY